MKKILKKVARTILPASFFEKRSQAFQKRIYDELSGKSKAEIFSLVYRKRLWDPESDRDFSSGVGSHVESTVRPYIAAVQTFLSSFPEPPNVVDLGCGDFNIGSQLRPLCGKYTACDVVPELIERNKKTFSGLNVDFRCVDMCEGFLPPGDIVFIRQVLQHLSNADILRILPKLRQYRFFVDTEHLSGSSQFVPNLDHTTGPDIRAARGSGVVVTAPPFNFKVQSEKMLCEAKVSDGLVRTILYEIQ